MLPGWPPPQFSTPSLPMPAFNIAQGNVPQWAWLAAGIIMMLVLAEYAPKWAGWLLLLVVLGYLAVNGRRLLQQ